MSIVTRSPPLKVVADNDDGVAAPPANARECQTAFSVRFGDQLPLPFENADSGMRILIVSTLHIHGRKLRNLLSETHPTSVVDLRELVRFDFPGTTRQEIFHTFELLGTHYSSDPLPWHELTAHYFLDRAGPISQKLLHEVVERASRNVMVLVKRDADAKLLASHVNYLMAQRSKTPWLIEFA